ncbi:unnamed protein product, partial [marine sediment metagenome]
TINFYDGVDVVSLFFDYFYFSLFFLIKKREI